MGFWDVVAGIATGGLYTAGKAIHDAGGAAEDIGSGVAGISATISQLGADLSSFINELEELLTIDRLTPRDEEDLWDEEVKRLEALRKQEKDLIQKLQDLGAGDDGKSASDYLLETIFTGNFSYEQMLTRLKLEVTREAINEILYNEPGVIPSSIHNLQNILERINTLEQPRIEAILDSLDDNLDESEGLLHEINKLFVVKTFQKLSVAEISEQNVKELDSLKMSLSNFKTLIKFDKDITAQLEEGMLQVQPKKFEIKNIVGLPGAMGGKKAMIVSPLDATGAIETNPNIANRPETYGSTSASITALQGGIVEKIAPAASQPMAIRLATELNQNNVSGFMDNYYKVKGQLDYHLRETLKIEKKIFKIEYVQVEKPGVIPNILEEIRAILDQVQTSSQPRVDLILDNVNNTVVESTGMLKNINTSLVSLQGVFDFVKKYDLWFKIGLGIAGGLFIIILLMSAIVLFRTAFGI